VALASAGSLAVVWPVGRVRVYAGLEPWASSNATDAPDALVTERSSVVWPATAMLGGVNVPPGPIFSLTRKCGVDGGGLVCVWWAGLLALLVVEVLVDVEDEALAVVEVELVLLVDEPVSGCVVELEPDADDDPDGGTERFEDVEWLLDPHAATSSAVISAAAVRFTIGPA
jgi:hypothetical protein